MAEATAAAECALWKKKPTPSAEAISSVPHSSGKACSDIFFTPPIRSFRDGMTFRRQRGRFLIKLACRWSRIAGIESHFNLARQRPSKPNWRALLRRRLLPRAPARPYQTTPKSRTTRRSSLQTRLATVTCRGQSHIFTYLNEVRPCSSWPEYSTRRNCGWEVLVSAKLPKSRMPGFTVMSSFGSLTLWCCNRRVIFSESRFPCGQSLDFYEQRPSGHRCQGPAW